ncbi:unnamed protein product [marine sediment metagenome]|uniref:Uncharacterized protein n=1 Tax=marine sediment metagenome TaxID=412755 RepID=X1L7K1_9ZZZZ
MCNVDAFAEGKPVLDKLTEKTLTSSLREIAIFYIALLGGFISSVKEFLLWSTIMSFCQAIFPAPV